MPFFYLPPWHTQFQLEQKRFFMVPKAQTNHSIQIAEKNSIKPSKKLLDWEHVKKSVFKHPSVTCVNQM
jgi:hypothetical protein